MADVSRDPTQATLGSPAPAERESMLEIGEKFGGRYVVKEFVGEGGMGAVYRALDEKLGVDVALKVVRGASRVDALRDEVRLAQKVTHPNVCRTYDLEEVGGRSLIKMEYVAGQTLSKLVDARGTLPIDDVVRIARAILAGLRAAHEQGIVHRDLKMANVMLAGQRPRVTDPGGPASAPERVVLMDFGVARHEADAKGSTAGTLGYMAPEQIANLAVDGRADLYALGCVVYAMLAGEPVFAKGDALQLGINHVSVPAPDVRRKRPDTPRWLARAVARLLAKDPAPRVLGARALEAGPVSVRRFALPAVALCLAAVGVALAVRSSHLGPEPCTGIGQRLAGVWDAGARGAVHDAFTKTKLPYAEKSFTALARGLDDYAGAWAAAVTDSCQASRVRGEQSEDVFALREGCFEERFAELRALVKLLAEADASIVAKGERIAAELDPIARCANVVGLRAWGQPPPAIAAETSALKAQLAEANAEMIAGRVLPVMVASQRALDHAIALAWDPILGEAYRVRGAALLAANSPVEAVESFKEAVWAGERGKHDEIVATAALSVGFVLSDRIGKPAEAQVWIDLGNAAAVRFGADPTIDATRFQFSAIVAAERGDLNAAVAYFDKAYAATVLAFGSHNLSMVASIESIFGATLAKANACGKAVPHYEHALEIARSQFGDDNLDVSALMSNLGLCYRHIGELAKARDLLSRSLASREKMFGSSSPLLVAPLDNYAELIAEDGDRAAALAMMERARKLARMMPGTAHPDYHQLSTDEAELMVTSNRLADAHQLFDDTFALERASGSPILPKTLTARAELALAEHKWPEADTFATDAVADFEAQGGAEQPELWKPLLSLAKARLGRGDAAGARPLLARALAVAVKAQVPEHDLAPLRAALAVTGSSPP